MDVNIHPMRPDEADGKGFHGRNPGGCLFHLILLMTGLFGRAR